MFNKLSKAVQQKPLFSGKHSDQIQRTVTTVAQKRIKITILEGYSCKKLVGSVDAPALNDFTTSAAAGLL